MDDVITTPSRDLPLGDSDIPGLPRCPKCLRVAHVHTQNLMAYQPNCVDGEKLASGGKMIKLNTRDGPTNTIRCKYYIEQPDGLS